jgi:dCMP deaminase
MSDMPPRPGWDDYFLGIAAAVAARGACSRSRVGAVLVRDNRVLSTGYNGAPAGQPSCLDGGCPRARFDVPRGSLYEGAGRCIAVHAEMNALTNVDPGDLPYCTVYVTKEPCEVCAKVLEDREVRAVWPAVPVPKTPEQKRDISARWDARYAAGLQAREDSGA